MAKQTTNHQLGAALAELLNDCIKKMRASEASIDQAKNEIKILLDKFMQIERQIYSKIDSSQLQVDTRPLEQVNQEIRKAGEEAGQSIKKDFIVILAKSICYPPSDSDGIYFTSDDSVLFFMVSVAHARKR